MDKKEERSCSDNVCENNNNTKIQRSERVCHKVDEIPKDNKKITFLDFFYLKLISVNEYWNNKFHNTSSPFNEINQDLTNLQKSFPGVNNYKNNNCPEPEANKQNVDGGRRALLVLFCCFLTNGIINGIINNFSFLYEDLKRKAKAEGVDDVGFKDSWVGSLATGMLFFMSSFVGLLTDAIGLRATAVLGGVLATAGMGISTLNSDNTGVLYFSYGIMFGTGASLTYTTSLTILGHYFHHHLGIANGIVTTGSSVFTVALSFIVPSILNSQDDGLTTCLMMYTCMAAVLIACSLSFKPLQKPRSNAEKESQSTLMYIVEKVICLDNWRNKRFVIWAFAVACASFGFFVPNVHIVAFAKDKGVNGCSMAPYLITCIYISSGIGRIICGKLSDLPRIKANGNRIVVHQVSCIIIGLFTMCLPVIPLIFGVSYLFPALIVGCFIYGLFEACFITMQGINAIDICGPKNGGQAIGFLFFLCSFPLSIGPPIAAYLYDCFEKDYTRAFILAGISPIAGSIIMLFMRRFPVREDAGRLRGCSFIS